MHRLAATAATATVLVALASAGPAVAQIESGPIGGGPIGGQPIGSDPVAADPAPVPGAPPAVANGIAGTGGVGDAAASDTGARIGAPMPTAPSRVRGYVARQSGPSVTLTRPVVVGQPLPGAVDLYAVPDSDYRYAIVDGRRVLVEPGSRRVLEVVE